MKKSVIAGITFIFICNLFFAWEIYQLKNEVNHLKAESKKQASILIRQTGMLAKATVIAELLVSHAASQETKKEETKQDIKKFQEDML